MCVGIGIGSGEGGAGGGGAKFFGVEARGSRFIFIVDVSGSMEGGKIVTLRSELTKSIDGLAENSLFIEGDLPFGDGDSLIENSVIDSTGVLELVLFLEQTFDIEVRDDEVLPENFDSVSRLASFVRGKQATHLGVASASR